MKGAVRFFHGAIGGLIPPLAGLFVAIQTGNVKQDDLIRAAFLSLILAPICGYYAYLQSTETSAMRLLQISLGVPALLTAITADVKRTQTTKELEQRLQMQVQSRKDGPSASLSAPAFQWPSVPADWFGPSAVHAAAPFELQSKPLKKSDLSWTAKISQAVLGPSDPNEYFVVTATYSSVVDANAAAAQIRQSLPSFRAQVFNAPNTNGPYAVVIGERLSYDAALSLRESAVRSGMPASTFTWTFGLPIKPPVTDRFVLYQRCWRQLQPSIGEGLYFYLADVSVRQKEFRVYLASSPKSWPVNKPSISEKEFLTMASSLLQTSAAIANTGGEQVLKLGKSAYLVKVNAKDVKLGGNESVRFEIMRLL